jgi:tetratricopeptide (TPR) repeat protein
VPEKKLNEEEAQLKEILELSDDNLYAKAIDECQEFLELFPESKYGDVVLLKLGEAYEGLLETDYYQLVAGETSEDATEKAFIAKHGHYQCWVETPCGLRYNLNTYKEMMKRFPESLFADEAEYHLIPWLCDYKGLPEGPLQEIGDLEKILQKYPTTSLKGELYYKIAYRFHVLYEIFSFSPQTNLRDVDKAREYKEQARYAYKMALKFPVQSEYSKRAWKDLNNLEEGGRIYIME